MVQVPQSPSEWRKALGFVPTPAAQAAATPKKVEFLVNVKTANPLVGNSFVQRVLQEEISQISFELKAHVVCFLAKELGDQFLTLCTKEVRTSTRTFAVFTLNQISEEVLSGISLKGKRKRFRDWREVVFTTVLQTPVVQYKTPTITPVPPGYQVVKSNHELLLAAERFGNCSFRLSQDKNILEGIDYIAISNQTDPVMVHVKGTSIKEMKHAENRPVTLVTENQVNWDFLHEVKYTLLQEGWWEAQNLPYTYVDGGMGMVVTETLRTDEGWYSRAWPIPYITCELDGIKMSEVIHSVPEAGWYKPCRLRTWRRIPAFLEGQLFWD